MYGIENHLSWLIKKEPGGDKKLNSIYKSAKDNYIKDLETSQNTDSVIVVLSNYK